MKDVDRRSALALGLTAAAAAPLLPFASVALAKEYGPTEGQEIFPGVRLVTLGTREAHIKGYKSIAMEDVVFQPKGTIPLGDAMMDDMVCTCTAGELAIVAGDMKFTAKEGDVWSCGKGSTRESATNNGTVVAVMRAINLKA